VDDGSENEAGKICDEYAEKFPFIKVLHIKNKGVSNARNVGIKEASGEYLMFLDADDWLDENICSNLENYLKKSAPEVLIFNYSKVLQDQIIPSPIHLSDYTFQRNELKELQLIIMRYSRQFPGINLCTPWCKLYKTEMIKQSEIEFIYGLKRAEDMLFNLRVLEYAKDVRFYAVSGYFYRINDLSESQTFTPNIKDLSNQIREYLKEFLIEHKKDDLFYEAFHAYCIENIFELLYMYYGHDKRTLMEFYELLEIEPFRTAHKKVKLNRLRYSKLQIYTLATRFYLRRFIILCIYYKNKTDLRGKFFRY
jgi:glycosyltransferase involved in cell wall biosynthesis